MMLKRKASVVLMVAMALVLVTAMAYAATITVDGDGSDWPGDPTCTIGDVGCALLANDPPESASTTMPAATDIRTIWGTNNQTTLFIRFDTEATTSYAAGEFVRLCLDTPSASPGQNNVGGCVGHNTDYVVMAMSSGARIYNCNAIDCNDVFSASIAATRATSGTVNEISVALSDIGVTSGDDGSSISLVGFFDNNGLPPDDNVPDSDAITWPIGTGSPTAVTLQNVSASGSSVLPFALGVFGLIVVSTGLVINRKRKSVQ